MRKSWDEYFLDIAKQVASRSTCLRVPDGVGCVLVRDKKILSTGYAGSIAKQPHCIDVGCYIGPDGGCLRTCHGEQNAVIQAKCDLTGATAYCTLSPCLVCFKILANAGVARIVYSKEYRIMEPQREWAAAMGMALEHLPFTPKLDSQ